MDVSVWVCPAAERKDQLVVDAHRQYGGLFPGIGSLRSRTRDWAEQRHCPADGSGWLAQECRPQGSRRSPSALSASSFARAAASRTLVAALQRATRQSGLHLARRAGTGSSRALSVVTSSSRNHSGSNRLSLVAFLFEHYLNGVDITGCPHRPNRINRTHVLFIEEYT